MKFALTHAYLLLMTWGKVTGVDRQSEGTWTFSINVTLVCNSEMRPFEDDVEERRREEKKRRKR